MAIQIKQILVSRLDEDFGELGLISEGMRLRSGEVNVATEGDIVAHDLIEHVNGFAPIGSIDDELEALGALWYVRGQHNDIRRDFHFACRSEESLAREVIRMFRDHIGGAYIHYNIGRMPRKVVADDALQEIVSIAQRSYLDEFSDESDKHKARNRWDAYSRLALARMRVGYRKARNRWEPHGPMAANRAFWAISKAVDPYCKHLDVEGERYELTYDSETGVARCTEQES